VLNALKRPIEQRLSINFIQVAATERRLCGSRHAQ
jgi:hypothetical protein